MSKTSTRQHSDNPKHACRNMMSFIIPALLTVLLIIVYTFIIQAIFADETLSAGISINTDRADSVYSALMNDFSHEDFNDFTEVYSMTDPRYIDIQSQLKKIRDAKSMRYLYTAGRNSDGTLIYMVDGLDPDTADFACPGTPIESEMIPFIETALSGQPVYSQDIMDTTWGHIYAACYPISANDGSGEIVGALCVEMDMESTYATISSSNRRLMILAISAVVIIILLTVPVHMLRQKHKNVERQHNTELKDSLNKVREREMILEALSIDYDSVYFCDLVTDKAVIVKEDPAAYDPRAYEVLGDKFDSFSFRSENYFKYFVEQDSAPGLIDRLSNENLISYLKTHSHLICRFKVKPNPTGHIYTEMKIVPVNSDDGFKIVMGFHYIDDIIEEQEHQKAQLENALFETQKKNEIISAIAKIYQLIYYVDLKEKTYEMVAADMLPDKKLEPRGSIVGLLSQTLNRFVAAEWRKEMESFLDTSTLPERLNGRDSVTAEWQNSSGKWYRGRFIVKNTDETGRATGVLYVAREITYEKQQELELKQRLKESAEEAKRANASKTDFLRRMSHDVRTPINGIRGMVEIANYYPNDLNKQKECRDKIWNSTGHLLSLVNNILDMNKLESGKIILQHKPFDLMKVIAETESITGMQAIEHNVNFLIDKEASVIKHRFLTGSATHLKQILLNFTSNAVKYNHEGGSVTMTCREISEDDKTAQFEFICEDNGIGMSEEFQKHAFEPFSQEEKSGSSTNYAGSGLGLSIAKQLVELMGGSIELHSREGVGTRIRFALPFEIDHESHETDVEKDLSGINLSGVRILLAEDNELNAEIAAFLFEKYGIAVTRAENGKRAVELFESSSPGEFSAIFMDVMMPIMGGLDATRKIRSLGRRDAKTIPIFAMTANAFVDDIQRSLDAGMNEHLTKPLQEHDIIMTLHKYIRGRGKK